MTSDSEPLLAAGSPTASTAPTPITPANSRGESDWRLATKLVQGGILRTPFGETCEAIYMTSGYVYGSAEEAEDAFANKKQRFIYSRFSNPTVQMFEDAGLAGINIEDQVHPKRCGHMPGKEVIPLVEGAKKIEAACLARRDDAFAIIARTDALAIEGIEGMLRRARAYAEAGADMIFADAVRTEDEIKRLVDAARVPVTVNMGFGIRVRPTTPLMSIKRLGEIGVRRVTLPRMLPAAAIHGMTRALEAMQEAIASGEPADRPDLAVDLDAIMRLMDYDATRELERRLLSTETLEAKYGPAGATAQAPRST